MLGIFSFAGGMAKPKVIANADSSKIENVTQDNHSQTNNGQNKLENKENYNQNKNVDENLLKNEQGTKNIDTNIKEMNINPKQNTRIHKDKIQHKRFTEQSNLNEENHKGSKIEDNTNTELKDNSINNINNLNATNSFTTKSRKNTTRINSLLNNENSMELCVIGNASKSVTPDYAKITAVIETLDSDMLKSKDNNFQAFEKVMQALKEQGINEEDIVLDSFTSYPSYDYSAGKSLVGYYTITTFTFNVSNLENIKNYVDVATENGVTSIRNINYELSTMDEVYQDVLMMAIDNAKEKAEKISGGEVVIKSIKEEYVYSCTSLYRTYVEDLSQSLMGCIDIEARVTVEFE